MGAPLAKQLQGAVNATLDPALAAGSLSQFLSVGVADAPDRLRFSAAVAAHKPAGTGRRWDHPIVHRAEICRSAPCRHVAPVRAEGLRAKRSRDALPVGASSIS